MGKIINLGIAPVVAAAIVSAVVEFARMGYSYYLSTQYAIQQSNLQKSILRQQQTSIAEALHAQFPSLDYDGWLSIVENSITSYEPVPELNNEWTKYLPYAIIGIFIFIVIKSKGGK